MVFSLPAPLPYRQATPAQRAQALHALRQRLQPHFPALPARSFARALDELGPDLWLRPAPLHFAPHDLTQLVQLLAASPELPLLDPPLYGLPALGLAQRSLRTSALAGRAVAELVAQRTRCGPHLYALVQGLAAYDPLAERVVQAWPWHLASSPPLPRARPGTGPAPGSPELVRCLHQLAAASGLPP